MNVLLRLFELGGPVIVVIGFVGVALFERCINAMLYFHAIHRSARKLNPPDHTVHELRRLQQSVEEAFQRKRLIISTMITAAPLLGLLGTVTGMIATFDSMAEQEGQRSMEGLAGGISEALTATQAGLVVAVPGVLALYYAHRLAQKGIQQLVLVERRILAGA